MSALEEWVRSLGFSTYRTYSIGMESLVRKKKSWPRQGMQFCTQELKIKPTIEWLKEHDPNCESVFVVGVRRCESKNRNYFPMFSSFDDGRSRWAPLVNYNDDARNMLLMRAGIDPLPHRSDECWTCINANRNDILRLSKDEQTIDKIANIESSMGSTAKGAPRTMYRPYRHQGAVGIREIVEWAKSPNGQYTFDLDDGNGTSGCEAGWCRS